MSEPDWFDDGTPIPDGPDEAGEDPDEEMWSARGDLGYIRDFARAYRVAPLAVLGVALARVVAHTPPNVVLPAFVGSQASLNLFVALVGRSGQGKGGAEQAGMAVLDVADPLTPASVGSGEGIPHLFVRAEKVWEEYEGRDGKPHRRQVFQVRQHAQAALLSVPEVDTIAALAGRAGSTLAPELRKAWMGEALGFQYASLDKRLPVATHAYRLALIVGVQPARAGALLDDVDGGTPQRYLWLPTMDPAAPLERPDPPGEVLPWVTPKPTACPLRSGRWELPVCAEAAEMIDANRLRVLRGDGDALDTHLLLTRLKVAAALGLLAGRCEVGEQDWALGGYLMGVSSRTRGGIQREAILKDRMLTESSARKDAHRAIIAEEVIGRRAVERVARRVYERLAAARTMTRRDVQAAIAARDRKYLDDALYMLLDAGKISKEASNDEGPGPQGTLYRFGIQ